MSILSRCFPAVKKTTEPHNQRQLGLNSYIFTTPFGYEINTHKIAQIHGVVFAK